jgi:hypothetical protein
MPEREDRRQGEDRRAAKRRPVKKGFLIYKIDGSMVDVPCRALVEVNFEQHFKAGVNRETFEGAQSSTRAYWMAWEAERQTNPSVLSFDDWVGTVEAIDAWEEALPLGRATSHTPSQNSASPPASTPELS